MCSTHCTKLRRECVYDSGKPVSRVKQLEEKVAELEGMIKTGGDGPLMPKQSTSTAPTAPLANPGGALSSTSYSLPAASLQQPAIDIHMLESSFGPSDQSAALDFDSFFPSYGNSAFGQTQTQPQSYNPGISNPVPVPPSSSNAGTSADQMFDFSTLDPNFMNLIDSFQNTSTGPLDQLQPPISNFAYDGLRDNQNGIPLPPYVDPNIANQTFELPSSNMGFTSPDHQSSGQRSAGNLGFTSPDHQSSGQRSAGTLGFISPDRQSLSSSTQNTGRAPSATSIPYHAFVSGLPSEPEQRDKKGDMRIPTIIGVSGDHPVPTEEGVKQLLSQIAAHETEFGWRNGPQVNGMETGMVGGWFDPADLPRVARDHL